LGQERFSDANDAEADRKPGEKAEIRQIVEQQFGEGELFFIPANFLASLHCQFRERLAFALAVAVSRAVTVVVVAHDGSASLRAEHSGQAGQLKITNSVPPVLNAQAATFLCRAARAFARFSFADRSFFALRLLPPCDPNTAAISDRRVL